MGPNEATQSDLTNFAYSWLVRDLTFRGKTNAHQ
jgi:hypothetical protein